MDMASGRRVLPLRCFCLLLVSLPCSVTGLHPSETSHSPGAANITRQPTLLHSRAADPGQSLAQPANPWGMPVSQVLQSQPTQPHSCKTAGPACRDCCSPISLEHSLLTQLLSQCPADGGQACLPGTPVAEAGLELEATALQPGLQEHTVQQRQPVETEADAVEQVAQPAGGGPVELELEDSHNFALSKDGAKVVAANKEARKAAAVLDSDSDTFLKNECRADKWVVIELSQVAKVLVVELSQFELYSSRVKDFVVRGRQSHPRTDGVEYGVALNSTSWAVLGSFTASKVKGSQRFQMQHPGWVKFLQVHFLSQYGSEPVCAVNDIRVYGKSAAEDLEDRLSIDAADDDPLAGSDGESESEMRIPTGQLDPSMPPLAERGASRPASRVAPAPDSPAGQAEGLPGSTQAARFSSETSNIEQSHDGDAARPQTLLHPALQTLPAAPSLGDLPSGLPGSSSRRATFPADGSASASAGNASGIVAPSSAPPLRAAGPPGRPPGPPLPPFTQAAAQPPANRIEPTDSRLPPINSASSSKTRHGGSVYDMLVQEIKSLKVLQKGLPRQLAEVQKEGAERAHALAADLDALAAALSRLQAQVEAAPQLVAGHGNQLSPLDSAPAPVLLQQVAALQLAMAQASKREMAMLAMLAMLAGCVLVLAPLAGRAHKLLKAVVLGLAVANGIVGVLLHAAALQIISPSSCSFH